MTATATTGADKRRWLSVLLAIRFVVALGMTSDAASQAPQPAQSHAREPPDLPAVPEWPPLPGAPAADVFFVERIVFSGHTVIDDALLHALSGPFTGRQLRLAEIEELRRLVTRTYAERGYVNSGVVIAEPGYRDRVLNLRVVEGKLGRVRFEGMGRLADAYLASRLVKDGEPLNIQLLQERFRLLLSDPLFARLNARLLPGTGLGEALLEIDVERAKPFSVSLFANNYRAPAVGSTAAGVDMVLRNLTGWGDAANLVLSKSDRSNNYDLAWSLPLAARSTTLSLRLSRGVSSAFEELGTGALDIGSLVSGREVSLAHPLVDDVRRRWLVGVTHSRRSSRTTIDGEPFSFVAGEATGRSEVESWRLFSELSARFDGGPVLALRATVARGRNNGTPDEAIPSSPATSYRLWITQMHAAWPLASGREGHELLLRASHQGSSQRLVPLEQFSIGGRQTVRGFRENQLLRDGGETLSAELHYRWLRDDEGGPRLTLVPFIDAGSARQYRGETVRLASIGVGVQARFGALEAEIFYARRLQHPPLPTHGNLQDRGIHAELRLRAF